MTESRRIRTTRIHRPALRGRETNPRRDAAFERMLQLYYQNRVIRHRMCEFLGRTHARRATAAYIVGDDGRSEYCEPASPSCLASFLEAGFQVERSLWDRDSLIADIDLEHENFDDPAAPWRYPERTFQLQKPVVDAALRILGQTGVVPLVLMSGRGFHLVWAVNRSSSAYDRLARLGRVPTSLATRYAQTYSPAGRPVDARFGQAYAGLGMILEFIGHRVLSACTTSCAVPVQITSIEVGPGLRGREIVSFDLSEYGDPLDTRHIRLPFSVYLKPRRVEWALGETEVHTLLPIFEIPVSGLSTGTALEISRDPAAVIDLARNSRAVIQDQSKPMEQLLDEYESSNLAQFHREFYRTAWDQTEDRTGMPPLLNVPPCAEWVVEQPNDWLLKPGAMQHLARVLTAVGWSPRAIARLIYSCYERDYNWERLWERLDAWNRALFYTRLFTGMIATGVDKLIDLNCVSHKEKGYCMFPECSSNLVTYRDLLLTRGPK